jgi:hypothetical protein
MLATVEGSARALIETYRLRAVFVAMDRLNKSIDRGDLRARDFWAQVVHAIHDYQRSGEVPADGSPSPRMLDSTRGSGAEMRAERGTGRRGMVGAGGN